MLKAIFYLHMPRRYPYMVVKLYFRLDGHLSKKKRGGGGGGDNNGLFVAGLFVFNFIKKRLFQVFTSVSGSSSAEEGCTDSDAYWETL